MKRSLALAALAATLLACRTEQTIVTPDPHLERMLQQPKRLPYDDDPILPHGMSMQKPPDGTLPTGASLDDPLVREGVADDRWAETIPIPIDRAAIARGRESFETFCAACHGILGDGQSVVADKMALRKPQDLLADEVRAYPDGRIFQAIRHGYGLMPSYDVQLDVREAWSVVAYVRALQLARRVRVSDLPPDVRAQLIKEAP